MDWCHPVSNPSFEILAVSLRPRLTSDSCSTIVSRHWAVPLATTIFLFESWRIVVTSTFPRHLGSNSTALSWNVRDIKTRKEETFQEEDWMALEEKSGNDTAMGNFPSSSQPENENRITILDDIILPDGAILKRSNVMSIRLKPWPNTIEEAVKISTYSTYEVQSPQINAHNPDCTKAFVVYEAACVSAGCDPNYIGSTTRPLHKRERKHIYANNHHDEKLAFGTHYDEKHPSLPIFITFRQLDSIFHGQLRLRIKEAYLIK